MPLWEPTLWTERRQTMTNDALHALYRKARRCYSTRPAGGSISHPGNDWAVSSAVEHYLDMVGVTGSNPVPPTSIVATQFAATLPVLPFHCGRMRLQTQQEPGTTAGTVCDMSTTQLG